MPKGRGANSSRSTHSHSRGSQAGNLNKYSMHISTRRTQKATPKYAPTDKEGLMRETAPFLERLRTRFRRRER
jgi:hypothetical protein